MILLICIPSRHAAFKIPPMPATCDLRTGWKLFKDSVQRCTLCRKVYVFAVWSSMGTPYITTASAKYFFILYTRSLGACWGVGPRLLSGGPSGRLWACLVRFPNPLDIGLFKSGRDPVQACFTSSCSRRRNHVFQELGYVQCFYVQHKEDGCIVQEMVLFWDEAHSVQFFQIF